MAGIFYVDFLRLTGLCHQRAQGATFGIPGRGHPAGDAAL